MIITGYAQRSIATQTGDFGYNLSVSLSNTTGQCLISFSGLNNNLLTLNFQSGKIYDNNNRYIYSYESNNPVILQGFINPVTHNLYANGAPIEFSGLRSTGYVNYMVVNPINCTTNFNFSLSGFAPSFSIPYINFGTTGITGTGYIINEDITNTYLFRFFNGSGSGQANYSLVSLPTGNITGTETFLVQRNYNLLPIIQLSNFTDYQNGEVETNFGDYQQIIPINYAFNLVQNLTSNISSVTNSGNNYNYVYWNNLAGASTYSGVLPSRVTFSWVSGQGGSADVNFSGNYTVSTGNLDGTQMVALPYVGSITGYQSAIFNTYQSSGVMIEVFQTRLLANSGINEVYFSGYNTGVTQLINATLTPVVQHNTVILPTGLLGSGTTGNCYFYWNNTFGPTVYLGLSDNIQISWVSGASSGGFSGSYTIKTGYLNSGGMAQITNYSPSLTGYNILVSTSLNGQSGILIDIIQNSGFSGGELLKFYVEPNSFYVGYTGYISGAT